MVKTETEVKTLDAEVFDYVSGVFYPGGGPDGFDKVVNKPNRIIYVPSEQILLTTKSDVISAPPHLMYDIFAGESAKERYERLATKLQEQGVKPKKVELPNAFLEWAKAHHQATNPPQEVRDALK